MTTWASESERLQYEYAAEQTKDMWPMSRRMQRMLELVGAPFKGNPTEPMARMGQTRSEREESLERLREQMARERVTGEGE